MANGAPQPKPPQTAGLPPPAVAAPASKAKTKVKPKPKSASQRKFGATIFPHGPLPDEIVKAARAVEAVLKGPAWWIIQDTTGGTQRPFHTLDSHVHRAFMDSKASLPEKKPINLVVDSPGGMAGIAYELAMLFRSRCGGFNVYIPEYAKSAATLLALGASNIWLAKHAEIGPLDVQVFDPERENVQSALDEVQSLERLNAFALQAVDAGMIFLASRSGKSFESLLPRVLHFVSEMLRPMFEKLDTVHYTQMSRLLKIGEEYAIRLLEPRYGKDKGEQIARQLVNGYPEHGFFIDSSEANRIGLKTLTPDDDLTRALEGLREVMHGHILIGQLKEIKT
jgi:hypothetical protein